MLNGTLFDRRLAELSLHAAIIFGLYTRVGLYTRGPAARGQSGVHRPGACSITAGGLETGGMAKTFRDWDAELGWLLPPSVLDFCACRSPGALRA